VRVDERDSDDSFGAAMLCWFFGLVIVYSALFGTGYLLYGRPAPGLFGLATSVAAAVLLFRNLPRIRFR
jgi:SSS family solute:Na+ symporter